MRRVRALSGALAVVFVVIAEGHLVMADAGPTDNPVKGWCNGVFRPGPGTGIVQEVVGAPAESGVAAGTQTLTYQFRLTLTSPWHLPPGRRVHVASCAVVVPPDTAPATLSGRKSSFSSAFDESGPVTGADITLTAPASDRICDEAKINGSGGDFRSNIICVGPAPTTPAGDGQGASGSECGGVLDPGPGTGIVQEEVGVPAESRDPAGTRTLTYRFRLTPTRPWHPSPGTPVHVASCAVVVDPNAVPTTLSGREASFSSALDDPGADPGADITLTVPASDRICDEAGINGAGRDVRSNIVCVGPAPTTGAGEGQAAWDPGRPVAAEALRPVAAGGRRPWIPASSGGAAPSLAAARGASEPTGGGVAAAVPGVPNSGADTPTAAGATLVMAGIGMIVVVRRPRRRR